MKFFLILAGILACLALTQQQDISVDATTQQPDVEPEAVPENEPNQKPIVHFYRFHESNDLEAEPKFEEVRNPLEYQFNDQFSVEPFLTFPPNAGGGFRFRYRF